MNSATSPVFLTFFQSPRVAQTEGFGARVVGGGMRAMSEETELQSVVAEVVDELNDAIFDPTAWERVVTIIGNWMPDFRPLLHVETVSPERVLLAKYVGWDPQVISLYATHYVDKNIFRKVINNIGINEVGVSSAHISEQELMRSPLYTDILAKSGDIRIASGFAFARNPARFAVLGFHYGQARRERTVPLGLKFQEMIAPAARSAFALAVRASAFRERQQAAGAIDNLAVPALVLDDDGRVIRANHLADELLRTNETVSLSAKGQLEAGSPHDTSRLKACFRRSKAERRMVTCPYTSPAGDHVIAHFVPMRRSEASDPFIESFVSGIDPAAIVYLRVER